MTLSTNIVLSVLAAEAADDYGVGVRDILLLQRNKHAVAARRAFVRAACGPRRPYKVKQTTVAAFLGCHFTTISEILNRKDKPVRQIDFNFAVHRGKTDTSHSAADAIDPVAPALRSRVYRAIRDSGGKTTSELAQALQHDYSGVQPRTSELRDLGHIIDSTKRRKNARGRSEIVWTINGAEA